MLVSLFAFKWDETSREQERNSVCVKQNTRLRHDDGNFGADFLLHWVTHKFSKPAKSVLNCKCAKVASEFREYLGLSFSCLVFLGLCSYLIFMAVIEEELFSHTWWWAPRWEHLKWSSLSVGPLENQLHCGVTSREKWKLKYSCVLMTLENPVRAFAVAKGDSKGNPRKLGNFYRGWEAVVLAPCLMVCFEVWLLHCKYAWTLGWWYIIQMGTCCFITNPSPPWTTFVFVLWPVEWSYFLISDEPDISHMTAEQDIIVALGFRQSFMITGATKRFHLGCSYFR